MGSGSSELLFLDVPGTATEQVRTCGFRRNLSSLDKASNMRDSVRLNFWESLLVTFSSVSSETWVMYSSAIPGISVFCDWLFLVFSGVSPETAANFLLFVNVSIILTEKLVSSEDWSDVYFPKQIGRLLFFEGKGFSKMQTVNDAKCKQLTMQKLSTIPERLHFI